MGLRHKTCIFMSWSLL